MLHGALQKHEREAARPNPSSQVLLSSSPPKQASQTASPRNASSSYRGLLKPATASAINGIRNLQPRQGSVSGVKRTASGLAKALDGSFDDRPGSQHKPISIDDSTRGNMKASQVTQNDFFNENEFDSDIELDVEEPGTVSYPKLPEQKSMAAPAKPVVYPTLPRQQQVQPSFVRDVSIADSGYDSVLPPGPSQTPKSSNPLPWSSSPSEHYSSALRPASMMQHFGYTSSSTVQALQDGHPPPKAPKRRNLPWLPQAEQPPADDELNHTTAPTTSKHQSRTDSTPLAKDAKKGIYPWNTSASAIKEQQRQHRDQARKAVKKIEGDKESRAKAKSTNARPARVFLSEEQQHVLDLVIEKKKSVFFTGSAGTGKSVLMREIISNLRKRYTREPDRVAVTASTGLAACNVGGVTLHSFAGIGLGKEDVPELVRKIKRNQKAKHRWIRTKVLIVDEVSMVDADLFDKLESIARQLRNNGRPFGGIQLVITGDFFQLPPVPDSGRIAKFAFDAATWNTTVEHTIALHHVFRQKDPIFAGMLNEMREGRLTESSIQAFRKLSRPLDVEDSITATELFPTRSEVDRANHERLNILQGKTEIFEARDGGAIVDKMQRDKLLSNCMAPESITLKKGAQVMLIKNVDETLVNGSLGMVLGFMSEEQFDTYQTNEDAFQPSPGASSYLTQDGRTGEIEKKFVHTGGITTTRRWPIVRFIIADGSKRDLLCQPELWKVELPNGEVQASRAQVPLILAWALSIHKAQGQTLQRVKVDLGKVFEKGQAYVALSRATSMNGLQVLRFDPKKVNAHERVRNFYSNLSRVELAEKDQGHGEMKRKLGMAAEQYEKRFVEDDWEGI